MGITVKDFGIVESVGSTKLYTITNNNGMTIQVTNFGATLVSAMVPDKDGNMADVILGYDNAQSYDKNGGFLGATIGRSGNRIGKAAFTLNGVSYSLEKNENGNNLHSGSKGYDKRIWKSVAKEDKNAVVFSLESPDGDEGYPGDFSVTVTYTLTDKNEIKIEYNGKGDANLDTIANLTNHSYFNLEGHDYGTILDHMLMINADNITAVDAECIPTGELRPVKNTPFDFRKLKRIGDEIDADDDQIQKGGGYDHNFAMNVKGNRRQKFAEVVAPVSGRKMEVFSDCVGMQFYAGNFIENTWVGKGNVSYQKRGGLCLETQYYPDAIHHENFASPILKKGEKYKTTTVYRFSVK